MTQDRQPTTDAVEILHRRYFEGVPKMMEMLDAQCIKGEIAQQLYDLREAAELTQAQLAEKVGSTAEVIDNLEETDYEGHELSDAVLMLHRIAKALGKRVEFQIIPSEAEPPLTPPQPNFRAESPRPEQAIP